MRKRGLRLNETSGSGVAGGFVEIFLFFYFLFLFLSPSTQALNKSGEEKVSLLVCWGPSRLEAMGDECRGLERI